MTNGLDRYDTDILTILGKEGRVSWRELADRIGLSQTPTLRRVKALEQSGDIVGYAALVDERRLGYPISAFISVSLDLQTEEALSNFEREIAQAPQVMECLMLTGDTDYLLRIVARSLEDYLQFLSRTLTRIQGVARVSTAFAVKTVVSRRLPPLDRPAR